MTRLRSLLLLLASGALLAACQQQSAPAPEGVVKVSPAAIAVPPGGQVQYSVTSPWGTDVAWSVSLPTCGTISSSGLFTASSNPTEPSGICTVVATLRSDTSKVGLGVVVVQIEPPVIAVSAPGQQQAADGLAVESVVAEPVSSVTARDASGEIENRSGFYPSGSVSP